jgi:mono/diheme cytochrome c family protein
MSLASALMAQESLAPVVKLAPIAPRRTLQWATFDSQGDDSAADDASAAAEGDKPDSGAAERSAAERLASRQQSERPRLDPQVVSRGQSAFESSCTQCHDADRALRKSKSLSGWLATVRRMARMEDADIDAADIVPIATYLASRSAPSTAAQPSESQQDRGAGERGAVGAERAEAADAADELALESTPGLSGTVSTLWRGGNDNLENPDFFPDIWLRLDWQPEGPFRGRVTSCTTCHSDQTNGGGFTLELVEATAHYDLLYTWRKKHPLPKDCPPLIEAEIKGGRFVVPFGAFAAMSHPGVYRTVTNPLIYNMGRQVNPDRVRPPVLPMPYSDEGLDLSTNLHLLDDWDATLDVYAVNGLQGGGPGVQFTRSRSYSDNNHLPAVGGRATVGNGQIRFGGSVMSGQLQNDMTDPLNYHLAGGDVTARFLDNQVRLYFEYAIRRNDTNFDRGQIAYGTISELEVLLLSTPNLSALARYDTLEHRDFFGDSSIDRFTWGLSSTVLGGSLLIVNHEHWRFSDGQNDVDVLGCRWVAAF